jgi:hypothetical protein
VEAEAPTGGLSGGGNMAGKTPSRSIIVFYRPRDSCSPSVIETAKYLSTLNDS